MTDFRMPSLGADMEAGTLVEWLVKPGDSVKRGDVVAVVETQKGAIEIEIFLAGTVSEIVVPVGELVPVGTVLARLDGSAESAGGAAPAVPEPVTAALAVSPANPTPIQATAVVPPAGSPPSPFPPSPFPPAPFPPAVPRSADRHGPMRASPAARRIAADRGIDLSRLTGSGPEGAIVVADVEAAARGVEASRTAAPRAETPRAETPPAKRRAGFDPAAMRQAIAAAMSRSKREIPHYYLSQTIDVSIALARLERLNQDRPPTARILPAALFLHAISRAVGKAPELNGYWEDGRFRPGDGIHVGWAVALRGGGLVAPAIRDADRLSLDELMAAMRDLVMRARASGLRSSEMSGATITVTSLGDRGAETVWPVIHPPQVAMVGVGRVVVRPWVVGDAIGPRPVVTFTLAGDHRASDGHRGGLLLAEIERLLQAMEDA